MTARDMIQGALRLIGALQPGEDMTASEAADGLDSLNQMLHEWPLDLQHEDLALSDELRVPPNHLRSIRYSLAIEIAPEYGKQISEAVALTAQATKNQLQNVYTNPARLDSRQFGGKRFNINRD